MSESISNKGDKNEEKRDYNKETVLGSITTTTSAEPMGNLNQAMLNEIHHNDTNEQFDLDLNEIKETRSMLSSSSSSSPDQLTNTASSEGKYIFSCLLKHII